MSDHNPFVRMRKSPGDNTDKSKINPDIFFVVLIASIVKKNTRNKSDSDELQGESMDG